MRCFWQLKHGPEEILASQMVGLFKISFMNIIIKSRNPSILDFPPWTKFPGKCVLVGKPSNTPCLFFNSLQMMGVTFSAEEQCRTMSPFSCFVVSKLMKERWDMSARLSSLRLTAVVSSKPGRNHLLLITLLSPLLHRCRLPVGYS